MRDDDEPVSVYSSSTSRSGHRVPAAPPEFSAAKWIPAGTPVDFAGFHIPGGMVYFGRGLTGEEGNAEASLIDPTLPVARSNRYQHQLHGLQQYQCHYGNLEPHERWNYLNWLAQGRQDSIDIGYVTLFIQGIERRVLIDLMAGGADGVAPDVVELGALGKEVRRLAGVYKLNPQFVGQASALLNVIELARAPRPLFRLPVPNFPRTDVVPAYVRLALAECAEHKEPLAAPLALGWLAADQPTAWRAPVCRCPDEFRKLFAIRYEEAYGAGFMLPTPKARLQFTYDVINIWLFKDTEITFDMGEHQDVSTSEDSLLKLRRVVDQVCIDLSAYSRWLASATAAVPRTATAVLLLPPELWPRDALNAMAHLRTRMLGGFVALTLRELAGVFEPVEAMSGPMGEGLAKALDFGGVGVEPHLLAGAKRPGMNDMLVLFARPEAGAGDARTHEDFTFASLAVQLGCHVAMANGPLSEKGRRFLDIVIDHWEHLSPPGRSRLKAQVHLASLAPVKWTQLRQRLALAADSTKHILASFAAELAQVEGDASKEAIKALEKVYKALGVDPQALYAHLHKHSLGKRTAGAATSSEPRTAGMALDEKRIAALQLETQKVTALLAGIFVNDHDAHAAPVLKPTAPAAKKETCDDASRLPCGLAGLDEAQAGFVHLLVARPEWTRQDLQKLADGLGLMLDGVLEQVNDAAYETHEMPLTEGEDPVTVNADLVQSTASSGAADEIRGER